MEKNTISGREIQFYGEKVQKYGEKYAFYDCTIVL